MSSAEEILKNKKEADARRSREYYMRNKEKVAQRRKEERAKCKMLRGQQNAVPQPVPEVPPPVHNARRSGRGKAVVQEKAVVEENDTDVEEQEAEVVVQKPVGGKKTPTFLKKNSKIPNTTKEALKKAMLEGKIPTYTQKVNKKGEMTKAGVNNGNNILNLIFRVTDNEPLFNWLKKPKEFLKKMLELKKNDGEDYSKSQWQKVVEGLMNFYVYCDIPISPENDRIFKEAAKNFNSAWTHKDPQTATRTPAVKPYEKVLIEAKKDKDRMTYLIAKLYDTAPIRGEYSKINIVRREEEIRNEENYIILPHKKNAILFLQDFKTDNKHETIRVEYPSDTTELLRQYVKDEKIFSGKKNEVGVLFGDLKKTIEKISKIACKGVKNVAANIIRRSLASTLWEKYVKKQATFEDIVNQAKKMGHSVDTHTKEYIYKLQK